MPTPCTSQYDNSRDAFYYYWSHSWENCPDGFQDFLHEVQADFQPQAEDEQITPAYGKLMAQNKGKSLDATILYGVDENFRETDFGVQSFRAAVRKIRDLKNKLNQNIFSELKPSEKLKNKYVFKLSSPALDGTIARTRLHLVLVNPDDQKFRRQAQAALQHDIIAYNGHSNDGDYFRLKKFFSSRRPRLNNDYQIFFIDSCSSYTFYHANLFQDKTGGSKNLHLVLNVVGAPYLQDGAKKEEVSSPTLHLVTNLILQTERYALSQQTFSWKQHLESFMDVLNFDNSGMPVFIGQAE